MSTSENALACEYATLDSVCEAEPDVVLVEAGSGFTGEGDAAKNVYCRPHADELLDDDRLDWQETDEDPFEVRA